MNLNLFEKYVISKESENSTCWNVDSTGCFKLSEFWKGFEKFDSAVKPIQPVLSRIQLVVFLETLTKFY